MCFEEREDGDLPKKLRTETGQVLTWLIEGHRAWMANGKKLGTCEAVAAATSGYFDAQTTAGNFIAECCEEGPYKVTSVELHEAYSQWKMGMGDEAKTQTNFINELSTKYKRIRWTDNGQKHRGLYGLRVRNATPCTETVARLENVKKLKP